MKATITSIELKTVFKFFPLSIYALNIVNQLKTTNCLAFKKTRHLEIALHDDTLGISIKPLPVFSRNHPYFAYSVAHENHQDIRYIQTNLHL